MHAELNNNDQLISDLSRFSAGMLIKPSVANSRLLNSHSSYHAGLSQYQHDAVKQERLVQNAQQALSETFLNDIDLDEFPDNIMDTDMDCISGSFNFNDQDFTSIRSIVEQTFKDGRDVLDIISAV